MQRDFTILHGILNSAFCSWNSIHNNYTNTLINLKKSFVYENTLCNADSKSFGYKLYTYRKSKNITRKSLANTINVAINTIRGYEKGITYPKLDTLTLIANALNIDVTEFYDEYILFMIYLPYEIIQIQKSLNLTSKELGIKVGIHNSRTVDDWKKGKHIPNIAVIKKLLNLKNAHTLS